MSVLSRPYFHDEAAAFEHVETILWPNGPVCHHCGNMERIYSLKGVRTKPSKKNPHGVERHGLYKCGACRKQFTVRMGTIFEESHLPLHKWLQAIHLLCSSKKGISAHQLHRVLECQYKTAWFLGHRIQEHWRSDYHDFGSVEGRLEAIQDSAGLQLRVRDNLFNALVKCILPDSLLREAFASFRRRVEVAGVVHYRANGTPISVNVERLITLPDDDDLPTHSDVRGILAA